MAGRSDDILAGEPLRAIARGLTEVAHQRTGAAIQPLREKASDHPVTRLKFVHSGANRFHHAGAIRHQDPPIGGGNYPRCDQQIMVVQRGGVQRHPDLSCGGRPRVSKIDQLQVLKRTGFFDCPGFHHQALFSGGYSQYWSGMERAPQHACRQNAEKGKAEKNTAPLKTALYLSLTAKRLICSVQPSCGRDY